MLCLVCYTYPYYLGSQLTFTDQKLFFILLNHMEAPEPKFSYKGEWFI